MSKKDPRLTKNRLEGFNKPKKTPSHPTKSHVVLAKKELTARQKTALENHKKMGTHTAKHMTIMKEEMLKGKTFMEAHRIAMRKKGK